MCTLSWLPCRHGYWLLFNRDERRTRAPGRPPTVGRVGGIKVLAPADGDFGGTWVGGNQFGVSAALLNRYDDTPVDPTAGTVSRGILLQSLLGGRSATALVGALRTSALAPFKPFTVAATDRAGTMHLGDWDGARLAVTTTDQPGLVRTSSGADQATAERVRSALFAEAATGGPLDVDLLRRLHRGHAPARGPFSICMHRDEAATQSLTEVRVSARRITLRHWHGPPCQAPLCSVRQLATTR